VLTRDVAGDDGQQATSSWSAQRLANLQQAAHLSQRVRHYTSNMVVFDVAWNMPGHARLALEAELATVLRTSVQSPLAVAHLMPSDAGDGSLVAAAPLARDAQVHVADSLQARRFLFAHHPPGHASCSVQAVPSEMFHGHVRSPYDTQAYQLHMHRQVAMAAATSRTSLSLFLYNLSPGAVAKVTAAVGGAIGWVTLRLAVLDAILAQKAGHSGARAMARVASAVHGCRADGQAASVTSEVGGGPAAASAALRASIPMSVPMALVLASPTVAEVAVAVGASGSAAAAAATTSASSTASGPLPPTLALPSAHSSTTFGGLAIPQSSPNIVLAPAGQAASSGSGQGLSPASLTSSSSLPPTQRGVLTGRLASGDPRSRAAHTAQLAMAARRRAATARFGAGGSGGGSEGHARSGDSDGRRSPANSLADSHRSSSPALTALQSALPLPTLPRLIESTSALVARLSDATTATKGATQGAAAGGTSTTSLPATLSLSSPDTCALLPLLASVDFGIALYDAPIEDDNIFTAYDDGVPSREADREADDAEGGVSGSAGNGRVARSVGDPVRRHVSTFVNAALLKRRRALYEASLRRALAVVADFDKKARAHDLRVTRLLQVERNRSSVGTDEQNATSSPDSSGATAAGTPPSASTSTDTSTSTSTSTSSSSPSSSSEGAAVSALVRRGFVFVFRACRLLFSGTAAFPDAVPGTVRDSPPDERPDRVADQLAQLQRLSKSNRSAGLLPPYSAQTLVDLLNSLQGGSASGESEAGGDGADPVERTLSPGAAVGPEQTAPSLAALVVSTMERRVDGAWRSVRAVDWCAELSHRLTVELGFRFVPLAEGATPLDIGNAAPQPGTSQGDPSVAMATSAASSSFAHFYKIVADCVILLRICVVANGMTYEVRCLDYFLARQPLVLQAGMNAGAGHGHTRALETRLHRLQQVVQECTSACQTMTTMHVALHEFAVRLALAFMTSVPKVPAAEFLRGVARLVRGALDLSEEADSSTVLAAISRVRRGGAMLARRAVRVPLATRESPQEVFSFLAAHAGRYGFDSLESRGIVPVLLMNTARPLRAMSDSEGEEETDAAAAAAAAAAGGASAAEGGGIVIAIFMDAAATGGPAGSLAAQLLFFVPSEPATGPRHRTSVAMYRALRRAASFASARLGRAMGCAERHYERDRLWSALTRNVDGRGGCATTRDSLTNAMRLLEVVSLVDMTANDEGRATLTHLLRGDLDWAACFTFLARHFAAPERLDGTWRSVLLSSDMSHVVVHDTRRPYMVMFLAPGSALVLSHRHERAEFFRTGVMHADPGEAETQIVHEFVSALVYYAAMHAA